MAFISIIYINNLHSLIIIFVFIASYGIAKCVREITRGSVMCRYLTTKELIWDEYSRNRLPDDLGSSYADVFCIDLVPIMSIPFIFITVTDLSFLRLLVQE